MRRIGAHVVSGYNGSLAGLPGAVLVNASPAYVHQVRDELGPNKTIVVRWETASQPLDNPEQNALDWFSRHCYEMLVMTANATDKRVCFQAYNEIPSAQAEAYWFFEHRRMELMHGANLPMALFSPSVGEFDIPVWPIFAPIISQMRAEDVVLVHEYWVDGPDIANPWHCARWQLVKELKGVRLVVGECGRDRVEDRGDSGWRKTCSRPDFERDLQAYNALICQYPNVDFAALYGCGWVTPDWAAFDANELVPWLIANTEGTPMPEIVVPKLVMPMKRTDLKWYAANTYFGPYDDHPNKAIDWNLESGGDSDLGQQLVAPADCFVVAAQDFGGKIGLVLSMVGVVNGKLANWQWRHLQRITVKLWDALKCGQDVANLGNAGGQYSAHLHEQICVGAIAPPTIDWRDPRYTFVNPAEFYKANGVDAALVDRLYLRDNK
jgi:hypothetical protein